MADGYGGPVIFVGFLVLLVVWGLAAAGIEMGHIQQTPRGVMVGWTVILALAVGGLIGVALQRGTDNG